MPNFVTVEHMKLVSQGMSLLVFPLLAVLVVRGQELSGEKV